jgi:WD40 repeat protein
MIHTRPNPYPGPRSFQKDEKLYGRQRETWELLNLLIAERIVLLSSPSGAGKTSLVQAALLPELLNEGFRVLPVMRPGLLPDQPAPGANRYVLSLLLALEGDRPDGEQLLLTELAGLTLSAYLQRAWPIPADDDWHGDVLIFDQFEEVLTVDPSDREAKHAFFAQVGEALRDRNRWAIFSMRDEFVAALDPYLRPIPARFNTSHRYRLDLLGPEAARQAMQGPAADQDPPVVFSDTAARRLADDLRRVQVQLPDGTTEAMLGPFIEPVQLQVVCRRLWDNLAPDDRTIGVDDLKAVGDVDAALRGYYADTVARVAGETHLRERALREWIDRQLITESGIRGQVLMGTDSSGGLANAAVWPLVNAHLVRAEQRRAATWFELAHDRLIAPVRADNAAWFETHLSTLQRQAALWRDQGQPDGLLLAGEALSEAERWQTAQSEPLETWETAFLEESRKAWAQAERERRQNRLIRRLAVVAAAIAIIAVAAALYAAYQTNVANVQAAIAAQQSQLAKEQAAIADQQSKLAEERAVIADEQSKLAKEQAAIAKTQSELASARELAAAAVTNLDRDAELSLLLALQAGESAVTTEGEDALRQALQAARLSQRLPASDQTTQRVAYGPGGRQLAVLAEDGRVEMWQTQPSGGGTRTADERPLWANDVISGAKGFDLAYSPDGTLVATTHGDGTARLWDASTGEPKATLEATLSERLPGVYSAAFSHDGRTVATGGQDRVLRLWDVDSPGEAVQELYGHTGDIFDVTFAPGDERLATAGADGMVFLWDATTGDELAAWQAHDDAVYAVDISPDGKRLVTASQDKTVIVWDITGEETQELQTLFDHTNSVSDARFSPDGMCLATTGADRTAKLWDAQTGQLLLNLPGLEDWGTAVAFHPADQPAAAADSPYRCGQTLATASQDGAVRLWNIGPNHEGTLFVGHDGPVESAAFSPDGRRVATGSDDGTARIWDVATGREELSLPRQEDRINRVAYSPDGKVVATASWDGTARVYDSASGELLATLAEPRAETVQSIAFSPDGTLAATANEDARGRGSVVLWEVASGQPRHSWGHEGPMYGATFNQDGSRLVATGSGGQIHVYDVDGGEPLISLRHGDQVVYDGAFSPDGKLLATASWDGTTQLWSMPAGELLQTLHGHRDRLYGVQFSPDGETLATSSADHTVRLWDVATGEVVRTLPGPEFNGLQFNPDGSALVAGGEDGTARIYTLDLAELKTAAANRLTRTWTVEECLQYLHTDQCPAGTDE